MEIKSFKIFENTANQTQGNTYGMGNIGAPQPVQPQEQTVSELPSKRVPRPEEPPREEPKNESVKTYSDFHLNEDAFVTAGNTAGIGNVSASQPGAVPGETSTKGSGDKVATSFGKSTQQKPKFKHAKKRPPKCEVIIPFNKFVNTKVNEDGGVAFATAGNTAGMGNVTAPTVSAIPGDVSGSIAGSGDLPAKAGVFTKTPVGKKKRKITKEHMGTEQPKENMYVTSYTDWLTADGTNENIELFEDSSRVWNMLEKISVELQYQRDKLEKMDNKLDDVIKFNNLKTK